MSRAGFLCATLAIAACGRLAFDPVSIGDGGPSDGGDGSVTPLGRVAYLKASNADPNDQFGASVAISRDGSTIAVGAPLEDSAARIINGDASSNAADEAGAVYVFRNTSGTWVQEAYIKASNADMGDQFGWSVALSGDGNTLVVGARHEDSISASAPNDNSASNAGAAYVFVRAGTTWMQQGIAKQQALTAVDQFGEHVAISDDGRVVAVGAVLEDSSATTINGNGLDDSFSEAGAAYTFEYVGNQWSQMAYIKPSNTDAGDWFGWRVSLSAAGDVLAVGAFREDSNASGVGGNTADDSLTNAGAVYLFTGSGTSWTPVAYVKASNPDLGDNFGYGATLAGDGATLVVTAEGESSQTGSQSDNGAMASGAMYVFRSSPWTQTQYAKAPNIELDDQLGYGLATSMAGHMVLAGAPFEDGSATGIDGNGNDNAAPDAGAAYLFSTVGAFATRYIKASQTSAGDMFGWQCAMSGDGGVLVISAPMEDGAGRNVNAAVDEAAPEAGAVYVYY